MPLLTAPHINLLSKRKVVFDQREALAFKVRVGAGVVLIVYVICLLLIVGITMYLKSQIADVKSGIERTRMQLTEKALMVQEQEVLVNRAEVLKNLMMSRRESIDLWKKAQQLVPENCEMNVFTIEANVLKMGIKAPHVLLANKVMDTIEKDFTVIGAQKMSASISRSEDASYQVDMSLSLVQSGEK